MSSPNRAGPSTPFQDISNNQTLDPSTPFQDTSNNQSLGDYHRPDPTFCYYFCSCLCANLQYLFIQTLKNIMHAIEMVFLKDVVKPVKRNRQKQHYLVMSKCSTYTPGHDPRLKCPCTACLCIIHILPPFLNRSLCRVTMDYIRSKMSERKL